MPRKKKDPPSEDLLNKIRETMELTGPCMSNTELADKVGVTKEVMRAAITALVQGEEVVKTGKKRWVRYTLSSMADQIPDPEDGDKSKSKAIPKPKKEKQEPNKEAESIEENKEEGDENAIHTMNELLELSLPQLDADQDFDHNTFGKAVIEQAPRPLRDISEYDVMRELPSLVRKGVMQAFKHYKDGWRFYYRRSGTDAEILSILRSQNQEQTH